MRALKARVKNGHLVLEEPTDLPQGTEVEVRLVTPEDAWADMDPEERAELEEEIEEGYRDIENGDVVDAREFLAQQERVRVKLTKRAERAMERIDGCPGPANACRTRAAPRPAPAPP